MMKIIPTVFPSWPTRSSKRRSAQDGKNMRYERKPQISVKKFIHANKPLRVPNFDIAVGDHMRGSPCLFSSVESHRKHRCIRLAKRRPSGLQKPGHVMNIQTEAIRRKRIVKRGIRSYLMTKVFAM